MNQCLYNEFRCHFDGQCIPLAFVGDGKMNSDYLDDTDELNWNAIFEDLIQRCSTIGTEKTCSDPSLFHSSSSLKCISKDRLIDGYNDCYYNEDELFSACQLNGSTRFICPSNRNQCYR
ncbi:unnamed protein product [Rotaria sordida]|uniref:Uncharacterized protein n=1 Tax=Rotaria sordida TaxID=392033 RepID=A0A813VB75_9BILA|nr:unnamed protein product [Rotaria sordida]CAF0870914.1 unnamed protein product [Rotaria sordida]CAF3625435.1 unnamed protein product [Rotaria sordida]CAF3872510.1 unnamed protein product [Rotaria sordida]